MCSPPFALGYAPEPSRSWLCACLRCSLCPPQAPKGCGSCEGWQTLALKRFGLRLAQAAPKSASGPQERQQASALGGCGSALWSREADSSGQRSEAQARVASELPVVGSSARAELPGGSALRMGTGLFGSARSFGLPGDEAPRFRSGMSWPECGKGRAGPGNQMQPEII